MFLNTLQIYKMEKLKLLISFFQLFDNMKSTGPNLKGRKIMEKDKREKISFICFLIASICFYIVSIVNFIDKNTNTAIIFLCLGSSFFCLSTTHLNKNDKNNKDK